MFSSCGLPLPPLFFTPEIELLRSPVTWLLWKGRSQLGGVCVCVPGGGSETVLTGQEAQNDRKVAREDRERKSLSLTLTG